MPDAQSSRAVWRLLRPILLAAGCPARLSAGSICLSSRSEYPLLVHDFSGSHEHNDSWLSPGSTEGVLVCLTEAGERTGGTVTARSSDRVETAFGSRSAYRLLGMLSPVRMRPILLCATVEPDEIGRVRILAHAVSDEGRYLIEVASLASRQFGRAFNRLFKTLREAAPPVSS